MHAELVRVALHEVDIKIVSGDRMHVLQWRRNLLWDEVLLDGKGGEQVMLILDPAQSYDFSHMGERIRGVRLEGKDGALVSYGSLEANALKKPATFSEWMKKSMGMDWGDETGRRPN